MTADEAARLNEEAKREIWKIMTQVEPEVQACVDRNDPYVCGKEMPMSRAERRALARLQNGGKSNFERIVSGR